MTTSQASVQSYRDDPSALKAAWDEIRAAEKPMRTRDAANFLGVSECELVASEVGHGVTRLDGPALDILKRVEGFGRVMALTRNEGTVHERKGVYQNLSANGHVGLALGDDIDLRLFFSHWKHAYAIVDEAKDGNKENTKRSLQFFDAAGDAVHKIFLQPDSNLEEFELVMEGFAANHQVPGERVEERAARVAEKPDAEIDVATFRTEWLALKDTHEFFGLLKRHGVSRRQGLRLAPDGMAYRADLSASRVMLETAAAQNIAIMVFVGNPGCIQIHTGPVANIRVMGPWLNVLDPDFNLHLREDHIDQAWVVKKPTTEGIVTSLELFNADGDTLVQFFGKRKPGIPELEQWRTLVERLPHWMGATNV
jgi:putative hemin transport protein